MEMFAAIILLLIGLILIVKGGDWFVDAASWIAKASGIPEFIIGATIVSIATTLPEQIVSFIAAGKGQTEMAIGNAIGSVTANVGLIMALTIIFMPGVIKRKDFAFKGLLMTLTIALLYTLCTKGRLSIVGAVTVLVLFIVFIVDNLWEAKNSLRGSAKRESIDKSKVLPNMIKFVAGAAAIVYGSDLLIDSATTIAHKIGVPEAIISVTLVAVGTSLPELVTTITALVKKEASMSIGNVVGANIIDLTVILPVCTFISGGSLPVNMQNIRFDFPICLAVIAVAVIPTVITQKFKRWQGVAMIAAYAAYLVTICI